MRRAGSTEELPVAAAFPARRRSWNNSRTCGVPSTLSQRTSISARGCGSIETIFVRRPKRRMTERANAVEVPEQSSR